MEAGNHAIVLASFELSRLSETSSELSEALNVDLKVANNILQHIPIVVFEDLTEDVAGLVVKKMKKLTDLGCQLKIAEPPLETQRKMRWPKPHHFVVEAREKASATGAVERNEDGTFSIACPKCGESLSISLVGELGSEKLLLNTKSGSAAPPKKPPISEIAEKLAAMPEKKPLQRPPSADGFMELDEFEAGLAELETDHGLTKPPEKPAEDLPGESAQLIGFEELEEVGGPGSGGKDIEEALLELDKDLPPVPQQPRPSTPARARPKTKAPAPPPASGGPAVFSVILPQIRSEKKRGEAALVISRLLKVSEEKALQMTNRVIVTVAKDVTEAKAAQIKTAFEKYGFKARVTRKK